MDNKGQGSPKKLPTPVLWTLSILAFLLVAFGVIQPFILRQLGEPQGQDISAADAISILIAVITILAGGLGLAAFVYARDKSIESATETMQEVGRVSLGKTAQGLARLGLNQSALVWAQLHPLLIRTVHPDTVDWFRREEIVMTGMGAASQAVNFAERMDQDDPFSMGYVMEAKLNLAFYLACIQRFVPAEATEKRLGKVFETLPTVLEITGGQELAQLDRTTLQSLESLSWAELCCVQPDKQRWTDARIRVAKLIELMEEGTATLARLRYSTAFGPEFLEVAG